MRRGVHYRQRVPGADVVRERVVQGSLRYPGGKRRLVPYVAAAFEANSLKPGLFVEPFGGGASVALELLATDKVRIDGSGGTRPMRGARRVRKLRRPRIHG